MDSRTQGYFPRPQLSLSLSPGTCFPTTPSLLPLQSESPIPACPVPQFSAGQMPGQWEGHKGAQGNLPFPSVAEASCKCLIDLKITMWRAEVSRGACILFYFWL